jgi:LuxR family maltose regulon positive regulatory protein
MGDIEGAARAVQILDSVVAEDETNRVFRERNAAFHAELALMYGDKETACEWADRLLEYELPPSLGIPINAARLVYARRGKDIEQARAGAIYEQLEKQGLRAWMIPVRICQALDSLGPGSPLECTAEALTMGRPEGFIRTFVDFGMELAPLLRQAITHGIEPDYARKLLTIIEAEDRRRRVRKGQIPASPSTAGLLSDREMEVLRLVAQGLSDRQIATRLVIGLSTAKTHVHRVIEKLNATSRMQAVTAARELRLI